MIRIFLLAVSAGMAAHSFAQNVGIGVNLPLGKLQVNAKSTATRPLLVLSDSAAGTANTIEFGKEAVPNKWSLSSVLQSSAAGSSLSFGFSGVTAPFTITGDGRTGINSVNPTTALDVVSATGPTALFNGGANMYISIAEQGNYRGYIGSYSGNAEDVDFGTYGSNSTGKVHLTSGGNIPRLTVTPAGNIGIGTTTPDQKLDVQGAVKIGTTTGAFPGTIRFNNINNDFEGYDGSQWRSFTANSSFTALQTDTASNVAANDNFGYSVKLINDYLFVGAPGADVAGNVNQGYVLIYKKNKFTGKYDIFQTITAPDGAANDAFGTAIDGKYLQAGFANMYSTYYVMIGAPKKTITGNINQGAVYLFVSDVETGFFRLTAGGKFSPADGTVSDQFGTSISETGEAGYTVDFLIGAPSKTVNGNFGQGRVYLCRPSPNAGGGADFGYYTNLQQVGLMDAPQAIPFGLFGYSIAISTCPYLTYANAITQCNGFYALIGAPGTTVGANSSQGKVFGFSYTAFDTSFTAPDGTAGDNFGVSIATALKRVYVGASGKQIGGNTFQGKVYIFKDTATGSFRFWAQRAAIIADDGRAGDRFGYFLKSEGDILMIGAHGGDDLAIDAGSVYIFEKQPGFSNQNCHLQKKIVDPAGQAQSFTGKVFDMLNSNYVIGIPDWDNPGRANSGKIIYGSVY